MDKKKSFRIEQKSKTKSVLPAAMLAMIPLSFVPQSVNAQAPIAVSGTVNLNFGEIAPNAGGTVTLSPAGLRTKTGAVTLLAGAGLESAGVLAISGSTGILIDVSITAATFTIDDPGGGAPMNVNAFDINGSGSNITVSLTANPGTFPVGATLNVAGAQGSGSYTGSYNVTANYQ